VGGLTPPSAVFTDSATLDNVSVPKSCVTSTKLVYRPLGYRPGGELKADFAFKPVHGYKNFVELKAVKFPVIPGS
jgi:hypothetical protein